MVEETQFTTEEEACLDSMEKTFCEMEKKQLATAAQVRASQNSIEAQSANLLVQERFGKPTTSSQRTNNWVQDSANTPKRTTSSEIKRRPQILDSNKQERQFMATTTIPKVKSTEGSTTIQELKSLPVLEATTIEGSATTDQDSRQIEDEPNSQEKEETLIESNLGENSIALHDTRQETTSTANADSDMVASSVAVPASQTQAGKKPALSVPLATAQSAKNDGVARSAGVAIDDGGMVRDHD